MAGSPAAGRSSLNLFVNGDQGGRIVEAVQYNEKDYGKACGLNHPQIVWEEWKAGDLHRICSVLDYADAYGHCRKSRQNKQNQKLAYFQAFDLFTAHSKLAQ